MWLKAGYIVTATFGPRLSLTLARLKRVERAIRKAEGNDFSPACLNYKALGP